ncbi:FUSC family protein [Actinacidiphila rubida]|uniref:FUSC family protein n=1 Tax=Actinacidiphila rubida TaxID=310780 RepID=UPI000943612B|nr:FUSC family protein [Actinacidiphila rubida]
MERLAGLRPRRTLLDTARAMLRRGLPTSARLPVGAAARGAVVLALPLLVGLWTGWVVPCVIAAVGALWGVSQDGADAYPARARRIIGMGLAATAGILAGEAALRGGQPGAVTLCLVVAAFTAGLISLRGPLASVAGLHLLLGAVIGSGIPVPGPWWHAPLALLSGVGLVLVLSTLPWLWRRHHVERDAVRAVYAAAARALAAAGTPAAQEARRALTDALDRAHDLVARHLDPRGGLAAGPGRGGQDRLVRAFHHAVRLGEAVTTVLWEGRAVPPAVARTPHTMAALLLPGRGAITSSAATDTDADTATGTTGTAAAIGTTGATDATGADAGPDSAGRRALAAMLVAAERSGGDEPAPRLPTVARTGRAAHLRYALLLALCVLAAQLCALALPGPRGYWLPMTVAFVYKPDVGPVFGRALNRCAGTVAGVAAIGGVSLLTDSTYAFVAAVVVFGAVMAVGVQRHYALATTGLTAVVFVLLDVLGGDHRDLYGPRVLDTALAAAIVLVVHLVLWPGSAADAADAKTEAALAAAFRYRELAHGARPDERHALRRTAYRRLAEARRSAADARREPARPGRPRRDWERAISRAERVCDTVTAHSLAAHSGAAHPGTGRPVTSGHARGTSMHPIRCGGTI